MADNLQRLAELHTAVRTRILEQIHSELGKASGVAASTQYTKSDGTNYGMYQKGDANLADLWDTVINERSIGAAQERVVAPVAPVANAPTRVTRARRPAARARTKKTG